jgi:hypothetical protein
MLSKKNILILLVFTLAVTVLSVMSLQTSNTNPTSANKKVFPKLSSQLNDISEISIAKQGESLTLIKQSGGWTIQQRDNYSAKLSQIRALLIGLSNMTLLEAKTRKPANFAKLELEGIDNAGDLSTVVSLKKSTETVATLILGKQRFGQGKMKQSERFIRKPDENQTWLASADVNPEIDASAWMESNFFEGLEKDNIKRVLISHQDGDIVEVLKTSKEDKDFILLHMSDDSAIDSRYTLNSLAESWSSLTLEDVKSSASIDFSTDLLLSGTLETFDGLVFELKAKKIDNKNIISLMASTASADPDLGQKVAEWNKQWKPWAYVIPSYKMNSISKKMSDLVKLEETTPEKE